WSKEVGDKVSVGDVLFSIETDKSSMDVESEFEGILLKKFYEENDACLVLTPVCVIGQEGEDISGIKPAGESAEAEPQETVQIAVEEKTTEAVKPETAAQASGELKVSPRARGLAEKRGVDPAFAAGTGPEGRVIERDIYRLLEEGQTATKAASAQGADLNRLTGTGLGGKITTGDLTGSIVSAKGMEPAASAAADVEYTIEKFTKIRQIIAANLLSSMQNSAQLTLNATFDATQIMEYRKVLKASADENVQKITLGDMVMYAVSKTVSDFPYLNAHLINGNELKMFKNVHLGFACDSPRGLMVPTIVNASDKSLLGISQEIKALASECQSGKISPDKLQGATFTVTNLGNFGIENFTPVINPPQTGILGVGAIEYKIKKTKDGFAEYPAMYLSLTIDHRAVDGAPGARFIQALKNNLENFSVLLAK
ncbi:MAG: 2-oxo acid dehydrogenase subunit E2, partial [Eubacteriaceae bacterium]|nr:2-oxo acid dehydrogenase subunit E2 [Eubacteriaceae bacterium]